MTLSGFRYVEIKKKKRQLLYLIIFLYSLIFVQNAEGVEEGKVRSDALKVLLRNIAIVVMVIIPENRLPDKARQETDYSSDISYTFQLLTRSCFSVFRGHVLIRYSIRSPPPPS